MNGGAPMHNRRLRLFALVGCWLFLGFILSIEVYFSSRAWGMPENYVDAAIPQFGRAAMWAALAPFILRMRQKMPLRRGHWVGGIAFHFAMSFVVMAVYYLGRMFSYMVLGDEPLAQFWSFAAKGFVGHNMIDMAFYWAVVAFGFSFEIYQRYKSEELKAAQLETRLVETELKALREQLRPHFLFNTMNTISVLVREGKNDEAVTLIARLSSLLRMSLDATRTQEVTLRQEVDFLERYVDIQKARFSDRLAVGISIDEAAMEARIPNLLLQPIVENAILHGIAQKAGVGRVDVCGHVKDGRLHLEVRDDGPGLENGLRRTKEGIGLTNTRERLAKIYGAAGHLSLRSEPGRGVTVQIVLPCRT
jgi:two-component system LytT family sensor kinase